MMRYILVSAIIMASITTWGCNKNEGENSQELFELNVTPTTVSFEQEGESKEISIETNAPEWVINNAADWVDVETLKGQSGITTVSLTAEEYTGAGLRSSSLTVTVEGSEPIQVTLRQSGGLYPSYNTSPAEPNTEGMESSAQVLASKVKLGWNIGNSLEAIGGETAWGNPIVSTELIDLVNQSGFNAVRIPCSWNQYMIDTTTAELKTEWLDRVKDLVQYCVEKDMYVLLNIHWDGGWLENNCTPDKQEENNAKQKAFWEQIATLLRDFDEHLMLASANEPNVENAEQMEVLLSYHQTFVNAVRSTGGRNSYRVLVVQGPATDIEKTNNLMKTLPTDEVEDKLMAEVHFYTPWNFCGLEKDESWGSMFYYWGKDYHSATDTDRNANWGEEDEVIRLFDLMENQFVKNGIPVLMGEYGAIRRTSLTGDDLQLHLDSRAYYLEFVTQEMSKRGIIPFYWDNGGTGNHAYGIFNRENNTIADQQALDALVKGSL